MSGDTQGADVPFANKLAPTPSSIHALFLASLGRTEFIREGCMSGDTQDADVPFANKFAPIPSSIHALFLASLGRTEFIREGCMSGDTQGAYRKSGLRRRDLGSG
jgi:hypothetical protein